MVRGISRDVMCVCVVVSTSSRWQRDAKESHWNGAVTSGEHTWQTAEHSAHSKHGLRVINENIQDTAMRQITVVYTYTAL